MTKHTSRTHRWALRAVAYGVAAHGLVMIAGVLEDQLSIHIGRHSSIHVNRLIFSLPILFGLGLLYIALLIRRGKRTAWAAASILYGVIVLFNTVQLMVYWRAQGHLPPVLTFLRNGALPLLAIAGLVWSRREFVVRSDVRSFASALRFSLLVLAITFAYGTAGFMLMDKRDFHQEITIGSAMHQTIDQFGLTTRAPLPHSRRAHLFVDSLSTLSIGAVAYAGLSLFQPLRARLRDETAPRATAQALIAATSTCSEDFFKLWPHDKHYFFNIRRSAGLAYGVSRGVAMVVGDPFGDPRAFPALLRSFDVYCRTNDWKVSFVHTEAAHSALYTAQGFTLQKVGEEAILDLAHFGTVTVRGKYFRQIGNKFTRHNYQTEWLTPPHSDAVISRLQIVSDAWLQNPGREERGFALGYFSRAYMQQCAIMVLCDAAGTIQAFINQVPTYNLAEANYDLLRYTPEALGNANDYLLMAFIDQVRNDGYERLNLGLCMLAGVGSQDERTLLDRTLGLVYAKGDRFYSFSGLHRFKSKYQPSWSNRYIAYKGGAAGFTRVAAAFGRLSKI